MKGFLASHSLAESLSQPRLHEGSLWESLRKRLTVLEDGWRGGRQRGQQRPFHGSRAEVNKILTPGREPRKPVVFSRQSNERRLIRLIAS